MWSFINILCIFACFILHPACIRIIACLLVLLLNRDVSTKHSKQRTVDTSERTNAPMYTRIVNICNYRYWQKHIINTEVCNIRNKIFNVTEVIRARGQFLHFDDGDPLVGPSSPRGRSAREARRSVLAVPSWMPISLFTMGLRCGFMRHSDR